MPKRAKWDVVPTHWIQKTPEGLPPPGVLLLIRSVGMEDDEAYTAIDLGYLDDNLGVFLSIEGLAIEADKTIQHFSIVHGLDGEPFFI